ncbi:hypothetical protein F442_00108 [Phytophthora nicotianae P10297]|uniref:Uncharacterized protein n=3 Tax=Phytophthora nicotianae TaxID=4792 RepID=V9G1L4_PHYNI|nr:hypothetical protein F443_00120 [Phytophthora nicotianae P1569]ETM03712.1 hypothetical protein L917_00103 [Phytophthora nicotianae]ETM57002.1 hypothetical protein L914_00110 [Phytophthora nicotianae]ETP55322.1 hypothetical protein F442_00108 [Phytophthora nicotianae P10297]
MHDGRQWSVRCVQYSSICTTQLSLRCCVATVSPRDGASWLTQLGSGCEDGRGGTKDEAGGGAKEEEETAQEAKSSKLQCKISLPAQLGKHGTLL